MIGIIGAGISGLTLGWYLKKKNIPFKILEASDQAGGYIQTLSKDGYLIEKGPNSILLEERHLQFLHDLGLKNELMQAKEVSKERYIFKKGKYRKLPSSPPSILFNSFLSWKSKYSIFKELRNKQKTTDNETVKSFFLRRFGAEVVDYSVDPFVAGIYAGDIDQLLIKYTFPKLVELESEFGSIVKGLIKNKSSTSRKKSFSFKKGLSSLIEALSSQLEVNYSSKVDHVNKSEKGWELVSSNNTKECFEKLVLTIPAYKAAPLFKEFDKEFSESINNIYYPPMVVVHLAFKKKDVGFHLNGFGGLHPHKEGLFTSGCIWSSSVFSNRCPEDEVLLTTFIGGTKSAKKALLSDADIIKKTVAELKKVYKISGNPTFTHLFRWEKAIPQYDINLAKVEPFIKKMESQNLYINANWWNGVSLVNCIDKSMRLAKKL